MVRSPRAARRVQAAWSNGNRTSPTSRPHSPWGRLAARIIVVLAMVFAPQYLFLPIVQADPVQHVTISQVDSSQLPAIHVVFSAIDSTGAPIANLDPRSVSVTEDGRAETVDNVTPATEGMTIVLAMDTSGSMNDQDGLGHVKIDAAKQAGVSFINTVKSTASPSQTVPDLLAVIGFNDNVTTLDPLSADSNAAINAIGSLKAPPGWTALYDAAFEAVKTAGGAQLGDRAVILFTDGKDEGPNNTPGSKVTFDDVVNEAKQDHVPIYTLGVGKDADAQVLTRMAELTGGTSFTTLDASKLSDQFKRIAVLLKSKYAVQYTSCSPDTDHSVQVSVQHDSAEAVDHVTAHFNTIQPTVTLVAPATGAQIVGPTDLVPGLGTCYQHPITRMEYRANGQLIGHTEGEPWGLHWDSSAVAPGPTTLELKAFDDAGQVATSTVNVVIAPSPTATATIVPTVAIPTATAAPVPTSAPVPTATAVPPTGLRLPGPLSGVSPIVLLVLVVLLIGLVLLGVALLTSRSRSPQVTEGVWNPPVSDGSPNTGGPTVGYANLIGVSGEGLQGEVFPVGDRAVIGRDPGCEVTIPDPTKTIGRHHAEIKREPRGFVLYDLGSVNGTVVGSQRVPKGEGVILANDVEITLGSRFTMRFSGAIPGDDDHKTRPLDFSLDDTIKSP